MGAMDGNGCKKWLDRLDISEQKGNLHCFQYVQAFEDFQKVVKDYFGEHLNSKFKYYILAIEKSHLNLNILVTT